MPLDIRQDDLSGAQIRDLVAFHLRKAHENSPPGSVFALDIDALKHPSVTFWSAWEGGELAGCGALKMLSPDHAEIKSMRVADAHLGKGYGRAILDFLIAEARARGAERLSLETGNNEPFEPARRLYASCGFRDCGPFADYRENDFSQFMTLAPVATTDDGIPLVVNGVRLNETQIAALREARDRRAAIDGAGEMPAEIDGPDRAEPTRFGDWEKGGRAVDF